MVINFDHKLKWVPHFRIIALHISKWSTILHLITSVDLLSSSFILIFKPFICSKSNYSYFCFVSVLPVHCRKCNAILASGLPFIFDALRSTPLVCIEVEYIFPVSEVRSRRLKSKFLLKYLLFPILMIFQIFVEIFNSWHYVGKRIQILTTTTPILSPFS